MMNKPKLTVSGYRGIWGDTLTNEIVENYTEAFLKFILEKINQNPTILLGRDGRESGPEIKETIIKKFNKLKINFIDGDILPTPTVLLAVKNHKYDGAIIITASHNPREYNGLKFITNKALFTSEEEVGEIINNYKEIESEENKLVENIKIENKIIKNIPDFLKEHADQIIKNLDIKSIRAKKYKIAVDMINASACVLDPYLFEQLGVELVPLNNIPNGVFNHIPEPLKENLTDIARLVIEEKCNLGFAHDPDADRLVIIDENGEIVFEEYTLALGVKAIMSKPENKGKNVVINMSTSQMSKDIADQYEGKCIRTKVGEANVVAGINETNAIIGGEGGGAIIYPTMNLARDSFVSLALILELLAKENKTVTECIKTLPKYEMQRNRIIFDGDMDSLYLELKEEFKDASSVNTLDGIRFDWNDSSWLHVRRSNTEPKVWIISEAKNEERINYLVEKTKLIISSII